jgi:hypothetical protein
MRVIPIGFFIVLTSVGICEPAVASAIVRASTRTVALALNFASTLAGVAGVAEDLTTPPTEIAIEPSKIILTIKL